mmetsp:Transcript_31684/g.69278  ORF Transcript_31684/g.69278 Transcript_31684/m.69278 type:complete len:328 (-) Transcript_31684:764-1747(-)
MLKQSVGNLLCKSASLHAYSAVKHKAGKEAANCNENVQLQEDSEAEFKCLVCTALKQVHRHRPVPRTRVRVRVRVRVRKHVRVRGYICALALSPSAASISKVLEERLIARIDLARRSLHRVWVLLEVGCVGLSLDLWLDGGGDGERVGRERFEERRGQRRRRVPLVPLHVLRAALEVAYPLGQVGSEQLLDQVLGVAVEVPRELDLALEDLLVDAERVLVVKRRVAREHLVDKDAQRPPVDCLAMPLGEDDLRRQVLGRAAQCPGAVLDALGEAKVGHFAVAVPVEQQVLRLQVAVKDRERVQMFEHQSDLGGVEARRVVREAPRLA